MHSFSVISLIAFIISCLSISAAGFRQPVGEVFENERFSIKKKLAKKDLICVYDDVLLSFETFEEDAAPFCSSYIGIQKATAVSTSTSATYGALS